MDPDRRCFLCGRNGNGDPLEQHHIFGGNPNRQLSEKYGLVVWLCGNRCHRNGSASVHRNRETAQFIHEYGQKKWMDETGGSIDDFRTVFGINYLKGENK